MPLRALAIATTLLIAVPVAGADASAAGREPFARQAATSFGALQHYFAAGHRLYREQYPVEAGDNPYSYEWPFSQAHVAALDLAGMPGRAGDRYDQQLAAHDAAQLSYWHDAGTTGRPGFASGVEPPFGTGGDFFYDDNEWVGLQDVQHWSFFHDRGSVRQGAQLLPLVASCWCSDPR